MKIDRLITIIMMLINKKRVTAKELAEFFEVSVRTIQRDIDAINIAGIPIVSYKGYEGGYEILEGYKIDNNFVTEKEYDLLLKLLKGVENLYDDPVVKGMTEKLKAVKANDNINIDKNFIIDFSHWGNSTRIKRKVSIIRDAIDMKRTIRFYYLDLNGKGTDREIEPHTMILKVNTWYVYGFCKLRGDFRLFRLTRIGDIEKTENTFIPKNIENNILLTKKGSNNIDLKLKFHPSCMNRLDDYFEMEEMSLQEDGYILVEVSYPEDEWVYSMILSFGDKVEILEPSHVKEIIIERVKNILNKYK
ncbi:helix-turn-helix transcriptional regulator [Clostridium folliculivorans]|uniref:DeoR family transcriptional regulator n=1 Tax=Clostridium folliculivorans TaxID=2886038 RepID=A0A9W5Y6N8_9CLOT|nr:YafY family protein [Clostridium folliculivorans]GKU27372.1 DeoR family transcriptional regulator [Clostridium folliculivorans]GKU32223.1 DeoR family transcriptional regulator [Clostridium folliculivorans]